jgi:proteasome activator subunit 4
MSARLARGATARLQNSRGMRSHLFLLANVIEDAVQARRLTGGMRRELVKCLRTVVLLAIFSQDTSTVSNVQSALKSMSCMEPDLVFQPVLERAIPSLEALVEVPSLCVVDCPFLTVPQTQRTLSVIKALSSIVPAIVSREIYLPGAKNLITILQLLVPGIDLVSSTSQFDATISLVLNAERSH